MGNLTRYGLASILLAAAVVLPTEEIEARRASHIRQLESQAALEAALLQPEDDSHIDFINHPYPIPGSVLFRALLVLDAVLVVALVRFRPRAQAVRGSSGFGMDTGDWRIVALLTLIGAAIRFTGLSRDLWIDEIATLVRHARGPAVDAFLQATSSNNHLLNSLLANWSISLFGEREWALRLPAAFFGTATIPVFYLLVRRYSGRAETALATAALTLSYHHVFFSQDARGYTGFLFGGLLATWALLRALDGQRRWMWLVYGIGMAICVASLMLGVIILAAQFLAVTALRRDRRFYAVFALVALVILHVYSFVIPDILGYVFGEYRQPETGSRSSAELVELVFRGLRLGPVALPVLALGAVVGLWGACSYFRRDRFFTALLVLPEILMLAVVVGLGAAVFPRFFNFALPVVMAFAARGFQLVSEHFPKPARRWAYPAAFAALVAMSAIPMRTWWRYPKQDYGGARLWVESVRGGGDAVLAVGIAGEGYRHYWRDVEVTNRVSVVRKATATRPQVWLLYSFPQDMDKRRPKLLRLIRSQFEEVRVFPGMVGDGEIRVCRYRRKDDVAGGATVWRTLHRPRQR